MNELIIKTLAETLVNNMGNRITPELANGIVMALNQVLPKDELPQDAVQSANE
jgi:hypothetical protein